MSSLTLVIRIEFSLVNTETCGTRAINYVRKHISFPPHPKTRVCSFLFNTNDLPVAVKSKAPLFTNEYLLYIMAVHGLCSKLPDMRSMGDIAFNPSLRKSKRE